MTTLTQTTLPATEIRKKLFKVLDEIDKTSRRFFITKGGVTKAVIMSADEWESWLETLEVMSDKKLVRSLRQAEKDFTKGQFYKLGEVFKKR